MNWFNWFRKYLWWIVFAQFSYTLAAADNSYRIAVDSLPATPTARYPAYFQIRVDDLLASPDPLLGSEIPTSSRLSAEIRTADGEALLFGPVVIPPQEGRAGSFALAHVFDRPGSYQLGLGLHSADGSAQWQPLMVTVLEDPFRWLDRLCWILLAALALWLAARSWNRAIPTRKKRVQAVILTGVFLVLLGLLSQQYLAPALRHQLFGSSANRPPETAFTTFNDLDWIGSAPQAVALQVMPDSSPVTAAFFPPLESGQPAVLSVTIADDQRRALTGELAGILRLEPNEENAGPPAAGSRDAMAGHAGHDEMHTPEGAGMLRLTFRETGGGEFQATVLPDRAGSYQLALHFQAPSVHLMADSARPITVAAGAVDHAGHAIAPASPPPASRFLYAAIILALLGALLAALLLAKANPSNREWSYDLFVWKPLYRFVQWKFFQPALWTPNLIVFALVIYLGIWDTSVGGRNLATKLTWTIWWAAIIFAFVFAGKIWCAMCPFGALTTWTSRAFFPKKKLPRMLRNIWIANLAFFFVTWADDYWGIVSTPLYTALLVILVAMAAMAVGYFFERATFCRHFCPIGGLIGIYSMFSGLELRAKEREVCRLCRGKECYAGAPGLPGCPMMEFPSTLARNNYCNLCGDCVRACPHENLALRIRPFARDIWKSSRRRLDEAFLAIALVGLTMVVTGHMIEPWHAWMDSVAAWIPWQSLGIEDHAAIEKATFTLVYTAGVLIMAPLLLLAAAAAASLMARGKVAVGPAFRTYAYMFIPVGIALHLAHNLLHLLKEGSGIVPVLQRAAAKYTFLNLEKPVWNVSPLVSDGFIYWLQMGTLAVFYVASIYLGCRIALKSSPDRRTALLSMVPMIGLSLAFTLLNIFLLSQPMAARHYH